MKYRLVQCVEGRLVASEFEYKQLIHAMQVRGFRYKGKEANAAHRSELRNQPTFCGVYGPMWDGDAVRYEDKETYRMLST